MPAVSCPLCRSRTPVFVRAVANRDPMTEDVFPRVSVSVCRTCGLIHQNPRISRRKMIELYATLEDKAGGGVTRLESRSRLAALRMLRAPPAQLLEVGCSDGTFLGLAREMGYNATGLEPSRASLRKARAVHPRVSFHEGFLENFKTNARFDVLCHFYVLEYSFEPRRFLAVARRLLKPNGVMLLEVPDGELFSKLPFGGSQFSHQDVSIFTRATLAALLQTAGFTLRNRRLGRASKLYGLRAAASPGPFKKRGPSSFKRGLSAMNRYFKRRDVMIARIESRVAGFRRAISKNAGPVVIFGAGENGRIVMDTTLGRNSHELLFCDNNTALLGREVAGRKVIAPRQVPALNPALVIAASTDYQEDMVRQMRDLGVPLERIVKLYEGF